jgi:hypothetical protein
VASSNHNSLFEWTLVVIASLAIFLPFLALQYDTNGLIEAAAVESGDLFNKNHLLYRMVGYGIYRGLQFGGYSGRVIVVLQTINAVCGALGVGFAYLAYKHASKNRGAAATGTLLLACSFTYWLFSTDAAYVTLAGMFAAGSLAAFLCIRRPYASAIVAGVLTTLSVLTWQASLFLIPALIFLSPIRGEESRKTLVKHAGVYVVTACVLSAMSYAAVFLIHVGPRDISSLIRWFTSYSENGQLPMWGQWAPERVFIAAHSALRSIVPTPLAVPLSEISWTVKRGRIAVDIALAGVGILAFLMLSRIRTKGAWFLIAYACFIPFIVWWDPVEPKWFLIPNVFLAGFFAMASAPWFERAYASMAVLAIVLFVAATNFVTTMRPRHKEIGPDRGMAQCVAANMQPEDLLIAAEWGWPDYLEYIHDRRMLNVISQYSEVPTWLDHLRNTGGVAYLPDPAGYSETHLAWLRSQSGVPREDLNRLAGIPAFSCYGRNILRGRP